MTDKQDDISVEDATDNPADGDPGTSTSTTSGQSVSQAAPRDPNYNRADFATLDDDGEQSRDGEMNLDLILDVPVSLSMEVGRVRVPIRNLLQLNQGSVVELDRAAGEPLDVYVNGTLIAHGEVVVVNEKFGVRLIDVVSPTERIRNLS